MVKRQSRSTERLITMIPRATTILRRAACVGAATALALSLAPPSRAHETTTCVTPASYSLAGSYRTPSPADPGSYDASISLVPTAGGSRTYSAWFTAYGEKLQVTDFVTDCRRAEAEVRVYRHADAHGAPYGLIDTDRFFVGSEATFDLGTPDGSGNITEGRWVAIRVRPEGLRWSEWAYGKA